MREPARPDGRGQRGRRPARPDPDAGPIAAFADRLWRLKIEAGDPSFAEMSTQLGAAASKSSLAAAAQGRTLPTWGTTWEFVRVLAVDRLGHDPDATESEWRELWRRTKVLAELDDIEPAGTDETTDEAEPPPGEPDAHPDAHPAAPPRAHTDPATGPHPARTRRRSRPHTGALVAVVAATLTVIAGAVAYLRGGISQRPAPPRTQPSLQVDDSRFEGDITYPDGTVVKQGESFEKVWRLRNVGTVVWDGRSLMRVNDAICRAPRSVEIPRTSPGQSVDIRVRVRAPRRPGTCKIYWKMVDPQGRTFFPGKRPIFLDVRIA